MNIKQRIEKIQQYFKEMQIVTVEGKQVIYVVVNFPRNWIIDEEIEKKFGITVSQGTNVTEYYFCTDIDSGEDVLFDAIDYNIDKMKEAIERAQLLAAKTRELKELFENESVTIEELRTLEFVYGNNATKDIASVVIPKQNSKKKEEEINNDKLIDDNE